jgi:hypothetical protein
MSNYVSAVLKPEECEKVLSLLGEVERILSFGIKLSPEVRRSMPKVDDGRLPFVEKCLQYGKQEPRIVPPFTDMAELAKDVELYKALMQIERRLNSLTETVTDTCTAAGCDAYIASLSIYKSAKGAMKMGVTGSESIANDLKTQFEFKPAKPVKE